MKISLENGDKIRTFSGMQKLKEFITIRPALQNMFKLFKQGRKIIPGGSMDLLRST